MEGHENDLKQHLKENNGRQLMLLRGKIAD